MEDLIPPPSPRCVRNYWKAPSLFVRSVYIWMYVIGRVKQAILIIVEIKLRLYVYGRSADIMHTKQVLSKDFATINNNN